MAILEANNLCYSYGRGSAEVLHNISCAFECGKVYALVGRSGSGKSTLLSVLSGLDLPDSGEVLFEGQPLSGMDRNVYRREKIAVIYQNYALLPLLTVTENILYPMELCGIRGKAAREKAHSLARRVGLPDALLDRFPSQISGGEQQRVAIARALAMDRKLLLADEPTGNLDVENSDAVMELLLQLAHEDGCCVVVVTHDIDVMQKADVVMKIEKGTLKLA